jgi:5,10-methylenetetrahydromethanopterin reductase
MRIGIFAGHVANGPIDKAISAARRTADAGFATFWLPQIFGMEALVALAVIGHEVPGIELGTSVVPTYPRHPVTLAQEALTTQSISGGRLALGIGLSHQVVIEGMFGMSFDRPLRHMREYLDALLPLLQEGRASATGETIRVQAGVEVRGVDAPPSVMLAALGPKMLALAGERVDGTITWMTGPSTIADHVVPTITAAATGAGRAAPRICAGFPVCVTADVDGARERAAAQFQVYGTLPSYRAMLDREGAGGPADVAIVGDEAAVGAQLDRLVAAGATDLLADVYGSAEERDRTTAFLASRL